MDIDAVATAFRNAKDIDADIASIEEAVNALDDEVKGPELVPEVLGFLERCGHQDDYGFFASLTSYLERHAADETVRAAVRDSASRAPSWTTMSIVGAFASAEESRRIYTDVLTSGRFRARDPRFTDDWLEKKIAEIE
jgi:hypothetical protein